MSSFVLDSYALLALLQSEPGADRMVQLLEGADRGEHELYMTTVNFGEIFYTVEDRHGEAAARELLATLIETPVQLVDVDRSLALRAARFKAVTGAGYLDCFVAALGQQMDAPVLTGDPDFCQFEGRVQVEWLTGAGS